MSLLTLLKPVSKRVPLRIGRYTPAVGYDSTATPKTTPAFAPEPGDLLVIIGVSTASTDTLGTPTFTGPGTVTLRESVVVSGYASIYLWTLEVGDYDTTPAAPTFTVSMTRTGGTGAWSFDVTAWRNHGGLGVTGKTNVASGAPTLALTTGTQSAVQTGIVDFAKVNGASRTWNTINSTAMLENNYHYNASNYTVYGGFHPDVGSAGSKTLGLSAPGAQKYSIVGVEILAAPIRTAPTLVATYTSTQGWSSIVSPRSVSVTAAAGDTLVLMAGQSSQALGTPTGGTGIVWTQRQSVAPDTSSDYAGGTCWTAPVPSGQTFTLTLPLANPALQDYYGFTVFRYSGVSAIGRSYSYSYTTSSSGSGSARFYVKNSNSALVVMSTDYPGDPFPTRKMFSYSDTGPAVEAYFGHNLGGFTAMFGHYADVRWAGPKAVGWNIASGPQGAFIVIELVGVLVSSALNKAKTGSSLIAAAKVGSANVDKMYVGSTQVWP